MRPSSLTDDWEPELDDDRIGFRIPDREAETLKQRNARSLQRLARPVTSRRLREIRGRAGSRSLHRTQVADGCDPLQTGWGVGERYQVA
jgi:hypothetical protein